MKAFLILEDGHVFEGTSIGATDEIISEIVFNTSMTGYLEVLTDPSYAGQAVCMTYPLIGNYGVCLEDMEADKPWQSGFIVREIAKKPSNFRSEQSINQFLINNNITGIEGVDTRALTKILRNQGTMKGMITTNASYDLEDCLKRIKAWEMGHVVLDVTCKEKKVYPGDGYKVAVIDLGVKRNIIKSLLKRGCQVTVYPAETPAKEIIADAPDGIMLTNGPGDPKDCKVTIKEVKKLFDTVIPIFAWLVTFNLVLFRNINLFLLCSCRVCGVGCSVEVCQPVTAADNPGATHDVTQSDGQEGFYKEIEPSQVLCGNAVDLRCQQATHTEIHICNTMFKTA